MVTCLKLRQRQLLLIALPVRIGNGAAIGIEARAVGYCADRLDDLLQFSAAVLTWQRS
jgi:hypothetical protein